MKKLFVDPDMDILRIRTESVLTESTEETGIEMPRVPSSKS